MKKFWKKALNIVKSLKIKEMLEERYGERGKETEKKRGREGER